MQVKCKPAFSRNLCFGLIVYSSGTAVAKLHSLFAKILCLYPSQSLDGTDCLIVFFLREVPSPSPHHHHHYPKLILQRERLATLSTNTKGWHLFLKWIKSFFIPFVFYLLKTMTSFCSSFDSPEAFSSPSELQQFKMCRTNWNRLLQNVLCFSCWSVSHGKPGFLSGMLATGAFLY